MEEDNHRLLEENQALHDELAHLNQAIANKDQEINQQARVIDGYKIQLGLLEAKLKEHSQAEQLLRDARHRNNVLVAEIERLNKVVFEQETAAQEYKSKIVRLDITLAEYRQFDLSHRDMVTRANKLADEVERLKDLLLQKHQDLLIAEEKLREAEQELDREREKNRALQDRLDELSSETATEKVLKTILVLKTELLRLNKLIENQNQKLSDQQALLDEINDKYNNQLRLTDDLRSAAETAERKQKQAEAQLQQANNEIERLKDQLRQLQDKQNASLDAQTKALQDQIAKLQDLLAASQNNLRKAEDDLRDALARLRDAEARVSQLERQVRDLDQMLQMNQAQAVRQVVEPARPQIVQPVVQNTFNKEPYERQIAQLQAELQALRNARPIDDRQLKRQIQDQLCLITLFCAEIESLRAKK